MINVAGKPCRLIGTEEHYIDAAFIEATNTLTRTCWMDPDIEEIRFVNDPNGPVYERLTDVGEGRLAAMDRAGVDMSLLSLAIPGVQLFDADTATSLATTLNDRLAETVRRHPTRFGGLAVFAPQDPAGAVKEIQRAMSTLKLNGLVVYSHTAGQYLDHPKFWPILEAIEALDAALYIHPRCPPAAMRPFLQNAAGEDLLTGAGYGFGMEAQLHGMRLMTTGVLDRFPKLKIVLGHMGEGLPYWLYRYDYFADDSLKRKPSEYFRDNFFVTTSGLYDHPLSQPTLGFCRAIVGADRLLFAADHPFQSMKQGADVLASAPFPSDELAKIAHLNAARVFHIDA